MRGQKNYLLRDLRFSSTVIGGIVVNLFSMVSEMVFSTGAFFSGVAEAEAAEEEDDAEADADSVSRGGVFSADSAVASSLDELPAPKSPFILPTSR